MSYDSSIPPRYTYTNVKKNAIETLFVIGKNVKTTIVQQINNLWYIYIIMEYNTAIKNK